ncbi:DUF92 domain-containing protein [Cytobacillus sp. IB215316]|uniref:DUF92 domain-containing protein n=1 Tax=Cytobacillus sp. IB215316 TaxID=3097354 RepID=UPI002A0F506F|nr:DUF92 domain-containing protein [Cytobacillus sp. IB215316]MDX8359590.1 DUF92 domain-containing protein [Cytobacillus sp. IB215316]
MNDNYLFYFAIIFVAALSGKRLKSLSLSGAIATIIIGVIVILGFGWKGLFILGSFFVSSSLWSKFKLEKKAFVVEKVAKGDERDWVQVLANGGVPAFASLLYYFDPVNIWLYLFLISIAAANADTWASELGTLSKKKPFLITTMRRVDPGTSGAMTILGTVSSLGGAYFIAILASLIWNELTILLILFIGLFGFIGSLIDTLLGATVQVVYQCPKCSLVTEKTEHCGKTCDHLKGFHFLNNDMINLLAITISALLGGLILL